MLRYIILGLILAGLFQVFFWITQDNKVTLKQNASERFESLSYAPFEGYDKKVLSPEQIKEDISILIKHTNKVRTYATADAKVILEVASKTNMMVDLGLWLSGDHEENHKEIQRGLELLKKYPNNINNVIVGNETLLRTDLNEVELMAYLDFVKGFTKKPITTAEVWHTLDKYPEIGNHVDFITVHFLPYWENVPIEQIGRAHV